jgi:hypothetical protein
VKWLGKKLGKNLENRPVSNNYLLLISVVALSCTRCIVASVMALKARVISRITLTLLAIRTFSPSLQMNS